MKLTNPHQDLTLLVDTCLYRKQLLMGERMLNHFDSPKQLTGHLVGSPLLLSQETARYSPRREAKSLFTKLRLLLAS